LGTAVEISAISTLFSDTDDAYFDKVGKMQSKDVQCMYIVLEDGF